MSWLTKLFNSASTAQYDISTLAVFNRQNGTSYRRWQDISVEDLRWYLSRYVMEKENIDVTERMHLRETISKT